MDTTTLTLRQQIINLWKQKIDLLKSLTEINCLDESIGDPDDYLIQYLLSPEFDELVAVDLDCVCYFTFQGNDIAVIQYQKLEKLSECFPNYNSVIDRHAKDTEVDWKMAYLIMRELVLAIDKDMEVFPPTVEDEDEEN